MAYPASSVGNCAVPVGAFAKPSGKLTAVVRPPRSKAWLGRMIASDATASAAAAAMNFLLLKGASFGASGLINRLRGRMRRDIQYTLIPSDVAKAFTAFANWLACVVVRPAPPDAAKIASEDAADAVPP